MEVGAGGAFEVTDASQVSVVRRAAQRLADRLHFPDTRAGNLAIVVSELATNLVKHARRGLILLSAVDAHTGAPPGVDVIALDRGPGMRDVGASRVDGFSTSGTLGQGLGAIERQSDLLEIYSQPSGTVILARVYRDGDAAPRTRLDIGAIRVNAPNEQVCGDAYALRLRDERCVVLVADGLGHGLPAHEASDRAVATFDRVHERGAAAALQAMNEALKGTRGAAALIATVDLERGTLQAAGIGNVAASIVTASGRVSAVSMPGIVGHGTARIQEFRHAYPPGAILVIHSDGLSAHWDLARYPGLRQRPAPLIAAVLYRDCGRGRDDATVVVVKEHPRV